ncbi:MAG: iron-sulfur cluster insertion protein ErpA [Actinomycetota bacterium]|jgi:iron-sulfur cluster assembly accessory protein
MTETTNAALTLTPAAIERISSLLASESNETKLRLRIEVKPGGCQGMNYDLFFDDKADEVDEIFPFGDFETVVDPGSLALINGATIDYEDTLTKQGLVIENPNATSTCACGESFC